jgi:hypothetical protein
LLSTLRALNGDFDTLPNSGCLGRRNRSQPFILCLLARLATFGFVLQALVMKKSLFARGPDEILVTVYTLDGAVWVFNLNACFHLTDFFPF